MKGWFHLFLHHYTKHANVFEKKEMSSQIFTSSDSACPTKAVLAELAEM